MEVVFFVCGGEVKFNNGDLVFCPRCLGHDVTKGGLLKGRQRYECRAAGCGRVFVFRSLQQLMDDFAKLEIRKVAQRAVSLALSVPVISKATGVPVRTIYQDIKQAQGRG